MTHAPTMLSMTRTVMERNITDPTTHASHSQARAPLSMHHSLFLTMLRHWWCYTGGDRERRLPCPSRWRASDPRRDRDFSTTDAPSISTSESGPHVRVRVNAHHTRSVEVYVRPSERAIVVLSIPISTPHATRALGPITVQFHTSILSNAYCFHGPVTGYEHRAFVELIAVEQKRSSLLGGFYEFYRLGGSSPLGYAETWAPFIVHRWRW
ncbi:hypothetical protein BJV74DRAFT_990062 [Russula compacta]|nr:hypothetical protein BJV74DRAFT_990062 [Russula compacta]